MTHSSENPMTDRARPEPNDIAARIAALDYSRFVVLPEYIDANGHMNVGYYTLMFDKALDLPWEVLGIYSQTLLKQGRSSFALESHLTYQRELKVGDPLDFEVCILDFDAKRVHYFLRMFHARERYLAATCEQISICIDMNTRRSTTWTEQALANIAALHAAHASLPKPPEAGRVIGIRRK
jgi:acyl-CoA thioester hydrolase